MTPAELLENANIRAFLRAIRLGEGTSDDAGYRRIVGGELFTEFTDHPRKRVWLHRYKVWSTAAGAYQFLARTWDEMRAKYDLPDFSPRSQDLAAIGLLIRRKAVDDILAGRIEQAITRCRLEWASLPGSPYGQRTEALERVLDEYLVRGGTLASAPKPQPVDLPKAEEHMAPFIAAALPMLIQEIPGLIRQFGKGEVTERNAQAAEAVLNIVQAATNTPNAQAAVEAVKTNPELRAKATEALREQNWFDVTEAGGGGIEGARNWNKSASEIPSWKMPVMQVTWMLVPMIYMVVGAVLFMAGYSGEIKALVIGTVMGTVLGAIVAFFYGVRAGRQTVQE